MKKISKFTVLTICFFLVEITANATEFTTEIDVISQRIFLEITKLEKVKCTLSIEEGDAHISKADGQIILSRIALNKLFKESSRDNFSIFLSIIIAHEYAHQIQFAEHKNEMSQTRSCEIRTFYEAQADIIAGYLFCRLNRYYETPNILSSDEGERMKEALGFMYNLGDAEYSLGNHPSFKQRRNSFRMGFAFAVYKYSSDLNFKKKIGSAYNINAGTDWTSWSELMAKAVCHSPNNSISNILVEDVGDLQWNKTQNNPTVIFKQKFTNLGNDLVHLFIQYKVIGENRTDPNPLYTDVIGDIKYFEFTLSPSDSYICSGTLNWKTVATSTYLPKFISPPDNEAIYFGTSVSDNIQYDEKCPGKEDFASNEFKKEMDFSSAISRVERESINNFQSIIFGFMTGIDGYASTSHQSKFIFPKSEENEISINKEDGSVSYDIGFGLYKSETEMKTIYASLKKCLFDFKPDVLHLTDDFSFYFNDDGTPIKYYKGYDISIHDKFELIKKNDKVERYIVEGLFFKTNCKVELALTKDLKHSRYEVNLSFIKN